MTDKLNHHTDPAGITIALNEADHANYLGDLSVVQRLLMEMSQGVLNRFDQVRAGEIEGNAAAEADRQSCIATASILAGGDRRYRAIPGWNDVELAKFVRKHTGYGKDEDDITTIAHVLAHHVHLIYQEMGNQAEAENSANVIRASVHSTALMMLGVENND